jgi:hypothetical protein
MTFTEFSIKTLDKKFALFSELDMPPCKDIITVVMFYAAAEIKALIFCQ